MPGIPVRIELDPATFNALEQIELSKGIPMRVLIAQKIREATVGVQFTKGPTRQFSEAEVDEWVAAAQLGVANKVIASRWGVSQTLVSRRLIERGFRRHAPRTTRTKGTNS